MVVFDSVYKAAEDTVTLGPTLLIGSWLQNPRFGAIRAATGQYPTAQARSTLPVTFSATR